MQCSAEAELSPVSPHPTHEVTKKKMKGKRDSKKGEMTGKRMQQWTGRGADVVDRDEEKEETERGGKRGRGGTEGGAVKDGWRLCKSERLEAHLNSGCVSPALAECYLL